MCLHIYYGRRNKFVFAIFCCKLPKCCPRREIRISSHSLRVRSVSWISSSSMTSTSCGQRQDDLCVSHYGYSIRAVRECVRNIVIQRHIQNHSTQFIIIFYVRCMWNFVLNTIFLFFCFAFNLRARGKFMDRAYLLKMKRRPPRHHCRRHFLCALVIWLQCSRACVSHACSLCLTSRSISDCLRSNIRRSVPSHANAFMISERAILLTGCFTFGAHENQANELIILWWVAAVATMW